MSITFECECGRRLKAGDDKAGRAFRCPACGATVKVPQPEFVAAVLPEEESASDNSHHLDEEDAPVDETSHLIPSIADDVDATVGALPPRVLPTPPPLGESVKPSVASQPSGAGSDTKRATGGVTAMQGYIIIAILLIGLGSPIIGALRPTALRVTPKWEYKIESIGDYSFDRVMDELGNEGWELVTARRAINDSTASYEMIFKRPK